MLPLYQFQCSHYCEKARWALDYKGLAYETRNLVPGPPRLNEWPYQGASCIRAGAEGREAGPT